MKACDFVIKYNPATDTKKDITKKIFYSVFIKRLRAHKPCVIFISGDSGEGKSISGGLKLQEIFCELQGIDFKKYLEVMNVFVPLQYPQKIDKLLFDKEYKDVNILCLHEAREVVKAKEWFSYLSQATADINAMSRSIKRIATIIISQFIRDVTTDIRYTINYYIKVYRPKGRKARLNIMVMWKDDTDLDHPKLRKRKIRGYLIYPNGKYRPFVPKYFEVDMPDKEIVKQFETLDRESKSAIIRSKINKLIEILVIQNGPVV
jgi:hypothetical protein